MSGFDDFDFLIGDWTVTNERLRERLVGSSAWETFDAFSRVEKVMQAPDGTFGGNLDQMAVPERGFTGMTLRLYNPETRLWSIYWSDTRSFRLFPPMVGRFENGRGEFLWRRCRGRPAGARAVSLDAGGKPALGTGDVGGWRRDVGGQLGDAVWEVGNGAIQHIGSPPRTFELLFCSTVSDLSSTAARPPEERSQGCLRLCTTGAGGQSCEG